MSLFPDEGATTLLQELPAPTFMVPFSLQVPFSLLVYDGSGQVRGTGRRNKLI